MKTRVILKDEIVVENDVILSIKRCPYKYNGFVIEAKDRNTGACMDILRMYPNKDQPDLLDVVNVMNAPGSLEKFGFRGYPESYGVYIR